MFILKRNGVYFNGFAQKGGRLIPQWSTDQCFLYNTFEKLHQAQKDLLEKWGLTTEFIRLQ